MTAEPGRFVAESFNKWYGRTQVLKAASSWAAPGTITFLVGRNGSGKSTLLRCATGQCGFDNGVVHWGGEALLKPDHVRLAWQGVFYLAADGILSTRLTVGQHFRLIEERFGDARGVLERDPFGLRPLEGQLIRQLSGGERRRTEITLALARNPACLLADEPLIGLAPKDQKVCAAELRSLADDGCAVLVTGHEVEFLLDLADEVHWIVAGGTYVLGTSEEARQHQQFQREYLGPRLRRSQSTEH